MSEREKYQESLASIDLEMVHRLLKETSDFVLTLEGSTSSHVAIKMGELQIEITRTEAAIINTAPPLTSRRETPRIDTVSSATTPGAMPIVAPLVGVFYQASSPGMRPLVEVGDLVEPGQKVGIIEAMKVMNEVICDYRGVVSEILVPNGEAVHYEQPLMLITLAGSTAP